MSENLSAYANYELGEAFFEIINKMVVRDGIPFSRIGDFEIVSPSWRKLADKKDKSADDIKKIDGDYRMEIRDLADSCMVYMGAKTNNKTYKFTLDDYKNFLVSTNVDKFAIPNDKAEIENYNKKIEIQFKKIANHGEETGDNLIDNKDFAAFIYALDMKSERDENNNFKGFILNGKITPMDYAIAYRELKEDSDNMISFKLRQAYKNLFLNNS